jgi:thioredoxin reductase (NADPH)
MSACQIDCVVIGGGPAGLTAAIYLARYRRSVVVIDAGESRAALIPKTHNYPGFAAGISGAEFIAELARQAVRYGAEIRRGVVDRLEPDGERLIATSAAEHLVARKAVLASGIVDEAPALPGLPALVRRGRVRFCPICDAFEATGRSIGVLGPRSHAAQKALFMRTFARDVVLLGLDGRETLASEQWAALARAGVRCPPAAVTDVSAGADDETIRIALVDGSVVEVDVLYPAMGAQVRSGLARTLGARHNAAGCLTVDHQQRTSVPNLYAIGDVTLELHQLSVAVGHAAIAATDIHRALPDNFL